MPKIGIDLSANRCHLIEVRATASRGHRRSPTTSASTHETRVLAFETIPYGWSNPTALLPELRRWLSTRGRDRQAWVTVWGLPAVHQLMVLPAARPADLARLARHEAARDVALLQRSEVVSGIMVAGPRSVGDGPENREVTFVAAAAGEIRTRIQPLVDAGFVIEGVTTPPLALCSIARLRRDIVPGTSTALLAIGSDTSAMAVVRDGVLLFAREMPWGYHGPTAQTLDREQFAAKLAGDLRRSFLFFKQTQRGEISQVMLCGDAPELRSLTAPLIMELDLETETLDGLDGIAGDSLPQPADLFRDHVAKYRLAWAIAADPAPPVNLVPPEMVMRHTTTRHAARLTGGVAAAALVSLLGYAYVDRSVRSDELEVREIEREVAELEPRARLIEQGRENGALAGVRRTALDAFDTQGPRLARTLETLAQSAPPGVMLKTLNLTASGASWMVTLSGLAVSSDPAQAQTAVNDLLRSLQTSPYFGTPVVPPSLRMMFVSSTDAAGSRAPLRQPSDIPAGMSGVEFTMTFEIRK